MPHESPDNPTLRQLIDACRTDSDALALPDFASLAAAKEHDSNVVGQLSAALRFDEQLCANLTDVEIPPGAESRLLDRLTAELELLRQASLSPTDAAKVELPERSPVDEPRKKLLSRKRRGLMAVAAGLLIATGLAVWSWQPQPQVDVILLAEHWQANLAEKWQALPPGPKGYPVPSDLAYSPRGWQRMADFGGYRGVAYDFSRPAAPAVLFVVRVMPDQQLPKRPPRLPQYSAGGRMMAAWIADKWLCLLVIDGNQRAYETLLRGRMAPLALLHVPPSLLATAPLR